MGMLSNRRKNTDESYVLVPLRDLMRNRRDSALFSDDDKDPLYVMFPFQELARKARDFEVSGGSNITVPIKGEIPKFVRDNCGKAERRERRGISSQAKWLLKTRRLSKRRPHSYSVRKERMSFNDMNDYDGTLHDEPLSKHGRPSSSHVSSDQSDKKTKAALYLAEVKSQLHPEMFDGLHQKPRILTDFSDLNPKIMQTIIGKAKKSSVNPINITMFITNLIPPKEVENTRITNAGKLYKNGCLKFSIQLERPGACSCSTDDRICDDQNGKSCSCSPVVTQKVAFVHPGTTDDTGKSVESLSSSTLPAPACGHQPTAAKVQNGNVESADNNKSGDPSTLNRDVSSLLLQLIGADKKLPKKPMATPGQTVIMDNEVIKALQRLFANQVASKGSDTSGKSLSATQAPAAAAIAPNGPKARAIAEALNLFSKYSSLKQSSE